MKTLWRKFPDDALSGKIFDAAAQKKLNAVFAPAPDSPWQQALKTLKLHAPNAPMLRWHHDTPYLNWTAYVGAVSGGVLHTEPDATHGYRLETRPTLRGIWRMMKAQWAITNTLRNKDASGPPDITESLMLGLVLQSLLMRLGPHAPDLPQLLATREQAPKHLRKILDDIQAVQMLRTHMSPVWNDVLPQNTVANTAPLPEFLWDDEAVTTQHVKPMPVCPGQVNGLAIAVSADTKPADITALKHQYNAPIILVFRHATPETTLLFQYTDALIFCDGGVLSHACVVARERNIPAITQMGAAFFDQMNEKKIWLAFDGAASTATPL